MRVKLIVLGVAIAAVGIGAWLFYTQVVPEIVSGVKATSERITGATGKAAEVITETVTDVIPDAEQVVGSVTDTVGTVTDVVSDPAAITSMYDLLPDAVGPYILQTDAESQTPYLLPPPPLGPLESDSVDEPYTPQTGESTSTLHIVTPNGEESMQGEPASPEQDILPANGHIDTPIVPIDDEYFIAEIESYIYIFTNKEREFRGLDTLRRVALVEDIARDHSQDMADRNYFSHITPEGLGPVDRIKFGYNCTKDYGSYYSYGLAENIWWIEWVGQSETAKDVAQETVVSWMSSPGHRANILEPAYDRIGVGVAFNDDGGMYATQNFC